jgi:hypothetical protein
VRTELGLKGHFWSESVLKWENHSLFEKYPLQAKWRNTCILWRTTICVRSRSVFQIVSQWELSYLIKRIQPSSQGFQVWGHITICQNSSIQVKGRSSISVGRKPSMLEAGASSTMFPCEKWVSLWKIYLWSERVLNWENHSLYEKFPVQWNGETDVSYGAIQYVLDIGVSCPLVPRRIELPFERNTAYLLGFSSVRNISFLQNSSIQVNWGNTVSLGKKTTYVGRRKV